jgi:hypothetical protein
LKNTPIEEQVYLLQQLLLEKYIAAFLNTAMKHGRLILYKLKVARGNFYCLPDWMDEDGELAATMREMIY